MCLDSLKNTGTFNPRETKQGEHQRSNSTGKLPGKTDSRTPEKS